MSCLLPCQWQNSVLVRWPQYMIIQTCISVTFLVTIRIWTTESSSFVGGINILLQVASAGILLIATFVGTRKCGWPSSRGLSRFARVEPLALLDVDGLSIPCRFDRDCSVITKEMASRHSVNLGRSHQVVDLEPASSGIVFI
jgi:hypothetical protein